MRMIGLAILVAFALPAQAQLYKCVDARGKIQYSDKPIPGCRAEKTMESPPSRAAPAPSAKAKATAKANTKTKEAREATNPEVPPPSQLAARCKTLRDEQEWLNSAAGKTAPYHTERVAQVEQALSMCN